jgi:hypothetical protein
MSTKVLESGGVEGGSAHDKEIGGDSRGTSAALRRV